MKIVHLVCLVRDLRVVYFSRLTTPSVNPMPLEECEQIQNNLRYWTNPPDWLKGRHMLLRYEDLAEQPILIAQKVYDFIGLKFSEKVKSWLLTHTNHSTGGPYSRTKVSNVAAHLWRTKIKYNKVLQIQSECAVPLLMAGYEPITSPEDLVNLEVPTFVNLSYPLLPNMTSLNDEAVKRMKMSNESLMPT